MAVPILGPVLEILKYVTGWIFNRSNQNNTQVMINNATAKMTQEQKNKYSELIKRAMNGDAEALAELQKLGAE